MKNKINDMADKFAIKTRNLIIQKNQSEIKSKLTANYYLSKSKNAFPNTCSVIDQDYKEKIKNWKT
jgi:hypothetical protein